MEKDFAWIHVAKNGLKLNVTQNSLQLLDSSPQVLTICSQRSVVEQTGSLQEQFRLLKF